MVLCQQSPVYQLVRAWWNKRRVLPPVSELPAMRESLWEAALREVRQCASEGRVYDPASDSRIAWAAEFIARAAGITRHIDPDIAARAAYVFDPPRIPSGKELAAGLSSLPDDQ